jgi:tripartite-type tricarboxylate transporter receptor subunit TctC
VATLDGHLGEIMREAAMVERFAALGLEPVFAAGDAFRQFIAADIARNSELLRSANFQPE